MRTADLPHASVRCGVASGPLAATRTHFAFPVAIYHYLSMSSPTVQTERSTLAVRAIVFPCLMRVAAAQGLGKYAKGAASHHGKSSWRLDECATPVATVVRCAHEGEAAPEQISCLESEPFWRGLTRRR